MQLPTRLFVWPATLLLCQAAFSQINRIRYNNQDLFVSGGNLAWISFANDIGPGSRNYSSFADILLQMHDYGGNAVRWWLHTNGTVTPQFNDSGFVIGPGEGTIAGLQKALDLAWEREIGVNLCLWSFDMLRSTNNSTVLNRNRLLLTDTGYTRAYITKCLIPMVDSLRGHPAILAWEIFNEPEGMTNNFPGFTPFGGVQAVSMSAIQRFVNLCAGAIHREDPQALVTNGAWSFISLSDVALASLGKATSELSQLSLAGRQQLEDLFYQKYQLSLTADEITDNLRRLASVQNFNYYTDSRLIDQGHDPQGTLDFYEVHYYTWGGTALSPFHHPAGAWMLNKPIVVAEFGISDVTSTFSYLSKQTLYDLLYQNGYAGALAWSWTDPQFSTAADMLAAMQFMWDNHRAAVDINGIGGDWPLVTITSPKSDTTFATGAQVPIVAKAWDNDGTVASVQFFANDAMKIGERTTSLDSVYSITWTPSSTGTYALTAVATDNQGRQRTSNRVRITVGTPMTRLEAEGARIEGDRVNIFYRSNPGASGGTYLDLRTNIDRGTTTISWTFTNLATAGTYYIAFGYRLEYDHPKDQYINVNGARVATLRFDGSSSTTWYEVGLNVNLVEGQNAIQMELYWGWMDLDYLAIPSRLVTSIKSLAQVPGSFSLNQNYPNPFNPTTTISFSLPSLSFVSLKVYDVLGREVATIASEELPAGSYTRQWDAGGSASGVYFYRITAGRFTETRKMLLLK